MKHILSHILLLILLHYGFQGQAQLKDALKLRVSNGPYSDETVVRFLEEATDGFDSDWDAYKLENGGNTPNLFTVVNNESYVINALNSSDPNKSVALNLEVAFTGTYTITSEEIGAFDSTFTILLYDKVLNVSQDLRVNPTYTFDAVKGSDVERFELSFYKNIFSQLVTSSIQKFDQGIELQVSDSKLILNFTNTEGATSISIYRVGGREIYTQQLNVNYQGYTWEYNADGSGIYIVEAIHKNQLFRGKVVLYR